MKITYYFINYMVFKLYGLYLELCLQAVNILKGSLRVEMIVRYFPYGKSVFVTLCYQFCFLNGGSCSDSNI